MSAFLCDNEHLSAIAWVWAERTGGYCDPELAACMVRRLYWENVASLLARYPGDRIDCGVELRPRGKRPSAIRLIKSIHCYAYQACEHAGWEGSTVKADLDRLAASLVYELPGYDDAPWGAP